MYADTYVTVRAFSMDVVVIFWLCLSSFIVSSLMSGLLLPFW